MLGVKSFYSILQVDMKLILAQGNPGSEYRDTRHNVGFRMLDSYTHQHDLAWVEKTKFNAYVAEHSLAGEKILFVKPTTYYNDTGSAVRAIADFYKIDTSDILVLHDDIALPLGTIRTRDKGSSAGNNGIKSLNTHLGEHYLRMRIGIWSSLADRMQATAFVLGKFTTQEHELLSAQQATAEAIIDSFIDGSFEVTSHRQTPASSPDTSSTQS